jgi:hypothetical protein
MVEAVEEMVRTVLVVVVVVLLLLAETVEATMVAQAVPVKPHL